MHIDLAHAAVSAVLILVVLFVLRQLGITKDGEKRFDWRIFVAIFVVMFALNLLWPASV